MRLAIFAATCFAALWPSCGQAQTVLMRDVTIQKVPQAGTLEGCSVAFDVGYQDHTHRQGLPSVVSGSVTWYLQRQRTWATLKVVGQDISAAMVPIGHFLITNAFIDVDTSTYLADEQSTCEHPQGFCAVYDTEKAVRLMSNAMPAFIVAFNRHSTGLDIRLPIVMQEPQLKEMAECMGALIARTKP